MGEGLSPAVIGECDRVEVAQGAFRLGPISHSFAAGVTCVVGANGSGKSTLFRLLTGLRQPDSGWVAIAAEPAFDGVTPIGYLPQELTFPRRARVVDWLAYVAWVYGLPRAVRAERVAAALHAVELEDRQHARIDSLSGGMRRRLGIAHAIVHRPSVLLLDEPSAGLDPLQRVGLRQVIEAQPYARAVIIATHLLEEAAALADQVIILRDGGLTFAGDLKSLAKSDPGDGLGETPLERAVTSLMGGADRVT